MKKSILFLFVFTTFFGFSQDEKSLSMETSYTKKVFYSFENGVVATMDNNNWDIAFAVNTTQTASISINGGFGVELYQYTGGDTSAWQTLDTAGLGTLTNWNRNRDNQSSYEPSAFEANATGHPNYGWGVYNNITHNVIGTALFVVKTVSGDYKKVWVKNQKAIANTITVAVSNLDNTNNYTKTIDRSVGSKNYLYMNLSTEMVYDVEPSNQTYDMVFTKYEGLAGPNAYYPLTGVILNRGVKSAEVRGVPVDAADLVSANFSDDIDVIGSDWKSFNMSSFQWELPDSLSYYVEDLKGNIWQLWFTDWEGTSTGNLKFKQQLVVGANVSEISTEKGFNIFPNPATENVFITISNKVNQISIFDATGKLVLVKNNLLGLESLQIGLNQFQSGIYYVIAEGEKIETQKLIVR